MPEQLTDIWLASNWNSTEGWITKSGRRYDIIVSDYGQASWSVACNQTRIGLGTIGWIYRADGKWGHIAGLLAVEDVPAPHREKGGKVYYAPGTLFPLPRDWWLDGARLQLEGWGASAPFGLNKAGRRVAQQQGGRRVNDEHVDMMWERLHPVAREWIDARRDP